MKPKKSKATEPSLRDKLSANFMKAFEADFAANGVDVIEKLRERSPEKYAELAAKLIAQSEPPDPNDVNNAKTSEDLMRHALGKMGIANPTEQQLEMAVAANSRFMSELEMIAALHIGLEVAREYEERSLRS